MNRLMVVAMAAVAAVSLTACGGPHGSRLEQRAELRLEEALDRLDATPKQRGRAQELRKQLFADAAPLVRQGQATREALLEQWKAPTVDAAKVHALVDAQLDAVRAFASKATDVAIEVHELLTPEQRESLTRRIEALHR